MNRLLELVPGITDNRNIRILDFRPRYNRVKPLVEHGHTDQLLLYNYAPFQRHKSRPL